MALNYFHILCIKDRSPQSKLRMRTTSPSLAKSLSAGFCVLLIGGLSTCPALDRVALVVGNDAYPTAPLANAVRDASAIRSLLESDLGFTSDGIFFSTNADRLTFFELFESFKKASAEAGIVLVYYAGHGMESLDGKENFLLPIDVDVAGAVKSEAVLRATGVNLMSLTADLADSTAGAKVILMDCCRERPAGRGAARAGGGLVTYADDRIPADTLMILAAAPERLASDGNEHGPFTEALIEVLPREGINLMDAFFAVSDRVQEATSQQQVPWLKFDGSGRIFREQSFLTNRPVAPEVESGTSPGTNAPPGSMAETAANMIAYKKALEAKASEAKVKELAMTSPAKTQGFPTTMRGPLLSEATKERPYVNPMGMEFVPVPGHTGVYLCRKETRVGDFRAFVMETGYQQRGGANLLGIDPGGKARWHLEEKGGWDNTAFSQTDSHPVVCVSWAEAQTFCKWLSEKNPGHSYRLPTDAEWSAANGSGNRYPWGNEWPAPKAAGNYPGEEVSAVFPGYDWRLAYQYADDAAATAPVGQHLANQHGFFDLGGNVWEWCEEVYNSALNDGDTLAKLPGLANPTSGDGTILRTLRGGSWDFGIENMMRSSFRFFGPENGRSANFGFRVIVTEQ